MITLKALTSRKVMTSGPRRPSWLYGCYSHANIFPHFFFSIPMCEHRHTGQINDLPLIIYGWKLFKWFKTCPSCISYLKVLRLIVHWLCTSVCFNQLCFWGNFSFPFTNFTCGRVCTKICGPIIRTPLHLPTTNG